MQTMQQFAPHGPLALDPRAFGAMVASDSVPPENGVIDGVAVVIVRGPLMARRGGCFDSYEAILDRVDAALARGPRAIVLDIDSPGGSAHGCFEASRALRERCTGAHVPLLAYVAGAACSSAYALACAAERIGVTSTSVLGSIGVFQTLVSQAAADSAIGLAYRVISSGTRKTDGNPHVAISDGAIAAAETAVESLSALFFDLVEEYRAIPASDVRALDGGIAIGRNAVTQRLADFEVSGLAQMIERVSTTAPATDRKAKNVDEIQKQLQAVIDDPNATPEDKKKASAALAAMKGETAEAKAEPAPAAASEAPSKDDAELAAKAYAEVHKLRAEIAQRDEEQARNDLFASRPDLAPEFVTALRKLPLASAREMIATAPRAGNPLAAAAQVQPTVGKGQAGEPPRLSAEAKAKLDQAMGLVEHTYGVVDNGTEQLFGVPIPKKA